LIGRRGCGSLRKDAIFKSV